MSELKNSTSQNRKQTIRLRESTALLPAAFVESPPPSVVKNEIIDLDYRELPTSSGSVKRGPGRPRTKPSRITDQEEEMDSPLVKRAIGRPRTKTPKMVELEQSWAQKKSIKTDGTNDENQSKSSKRKDTSIETESISPPIKRIKLNPGPKTSILSKPFDCIQISEEMKRKIIKNQPILRLKRINDCIVSITNIKPSNISTKINQRPTNHNATTRPPSPVTEPVFIAVEEDNIESNVIPQHRIDSNDTNISSSVMCRLCGVAGANRFSLIGMKSERLNLLCHLQQYLNIKILDEENLPLHICPLCSQTINSFYKFHRRVKTATNRLQAIVNESALNPQRSWESLPWYGDNILATATATNDYLTRKHLRKLDENNKGKGKNGSTKFVTTNIEKLFGNKTKSSNGINPELIVESVEDEDSEDVDDDVMDRDWVPSESPSFAKSTPKLKKIPKNINTSKNQIETSSQIPKLQPGKIQSMPRLVLSKPPTMTPKPTITNNTIPILNTGSITGENSSGAKTFLIPIQNLINAGGKTVLNQGTPMKFALSQNGQPILIQSPGGNAIKFVPNSNITDVLPKPLASIKGITNNTTSSTTNINQIVTTSNTSIPIQTVSPVATILPNVSPTILNSNLSSTIIVNRPNVQTKLQQSLNTLKTTSNLSTTSTSPTKLVTPLKNAATKTCSTPKISVISTLEKISTPIIPKTTSLTSLTIATSSSTKPTSTPLKIASTLSKLANISSKPMSTITKPISTPVKPTIVNTVKSISTPTAKGSLLLPGKIIVNKTPISTALKPVESPTTNPSILITPISTALKPIESPTTKPSISKTTSDMLDCSQLDPLEERKLNAVFQPPSKDDKYTYVVRMDRKIGEQPYFILTANPIKLKSPELTHNNVGIICKDVYKAEVEKKRVQESEGNFSNIGLHCWAQHIVWLWQLKLPGNVAMYVKQSADKILKFGQRKRIDFAKKCFEVSKQICTEAAIKSKNQSTDTNKSVTSSTTPKLISKYSKTTEILPKLIPKDTNKTILIPKLKSKNSSLTSVTSQQLILIPVTNTLKSGNTTVTYVISPNSNMKLQNISKSSNPQSTSNVKLVSAIDEKPISSSKQQQTKSSSNVSDVLQNVTILNAEDYEPINDDQLMNDSIEIVGVSTSSTSDDANKKVDETKKVQLIYSDEDKGDGMFNMECVGSDDEDNDTSNNDKTDDLLKQATVDALGVEEIIESDDITTNVQMDGIIESDNTNNIQIENIETLETIEETIDFDPSTSDMVIML